MVLPSSPPLSPYGTMDGSIFQFHRNLVAFESPPAALAQSIDDSAAAAAAAAATTTTSPSPSSTKHHRPNKCILIGGLSDGLLPCPYTDDLLNMCNSIPSSSTTTSDDDGEISSSNNNNSSTDDASWSLVQPILSSTYLGFGNGDLDRDTKELDALLQYLQVHRGAQNVALVGHSTGCQNSIHYLKYGAPELRPLVRVVVLQAPVSDREGPQHDHPEQWKRHTDMAKQMIQDERGMEMMPREAFWAPITAKRFLDLQGIGGADDFFSSDFSDEELAERLGHVSGNSGSDSKLKHVLVAFSGSDEYVPKQAIPDGKAHTDRLVKAMNSGLSSSSSSDGEDMSKIAKALYLPNGNHNLSKGPGDAQVFVETIGELLRTVS